MLVLSHKKCFEKETILSYLLHSRQLFFITLQLIIVCPIWIVFEFPRLECRGASEQSRLGS